MRISDNVLVRGRVCKGVNIGREEETRNENFRKVCIVVVVLCVLL